MPRSLPPEILDLVTDQLHDEPTTLKACCLVSKSWISQTQRHLFAHVEFDSLGHTFKSWMETFPDPSNSPAHHTRSLVISHLPEASFSLGTGGWIHAFHNVTHFHFERNTRASYDVPLTPFFGFSPAVRSLRLTSTSSEIFDLICSFPLLEDLALINFCPEGGIVRWKAPSTSPKLTGSLDLTARGGINSATRQLLDFQGGLHFAKITVTCIGEDFGSVKDLVSKCSGTLESLDVRCFLMGMFPSVPLIGQNLTTLRGRSHA